MSNFSKKTFSRRYSPLPKYSPNSRKKHSRSRSPQYENQSKKRSHPLRSTIDDNSRFKLRSPPHPAHFFIRPINEKTREEELIRYNPPPNEVLAIFGLGKRVVEKDLFDLYRSFGVRDCKVIIEKHTGNPKGFGFAYFNRTKDAIIARDKTDGILIFGKPIRVDFSIGERDYSALKPVRPRMEIEFQRFSDHFTSHSSRVRDYRDLREERISSRIIEARPHDHRMPRYINDESRYVKAASPFFQDRYSPYRYELKNYSNQDRHRGVTTPPLVQSDKSINHPYKRSRSRSLERPRKKQ